MPEIISNPFWSGFSFFHDPFMHHSGGDAQNLNSYYLYVLLSPSRTNYLSTLIPLSSTLFLWLLPWFRLSLLSGYLCKPSKQFSCFQEYIPSLLCPSFFYRQIAVWLYSPSMQTLRLKSKQPSLRNKDLSDLGLACFLLSPSAISCLVFLSCLSTISRKF